MNAHTTIAKPSRKKLTLASSKALPDPAPAAAIAPPAKPRLVPSSPRLFPLRQLRRAEENVRHVRIDEDVKPLAADIAAHGLLQSLIGYERDDLVYIVGGGRRYQALRHLWDEAVIDDGDFPIPVLIRDVEDAIELSLAENLQQRTMSAVDEFLAFKALMDKGTNSPAGLAKRFGFSERIVKQRLRLAELAPEILDALAGKDITIDAAMAYASSQDQALQREVFKSQAKRTWESHKPSSIRNDLTSKGMRTTDAIFRFVTAEIYERDGGGYEDDLFNEETAKDGRILDKPFVAETAARRMVDFQVIALIEQLKQSNSWAATIAGHVTVPDLRLRAWGTQAKLTPPKGFVEIDEYDHAKVWRTIRNNGIDVHVVVGIDDAGKLVAWPRKLFVPKEQRNAVGRPALAEAQRETPEQTAARMRSAGVLRWARRLAVGPFAGTAFEGRAFWPQGYGSEPIATKVDGVTGWYVPINIFVPDTAVAGHLREAEATYDAEVARREADAKAAEDARVAERHRREQLLAMDPPAVVVVDGQAWAMVDAEPWDSGTNREYALIENDDGDRMPSWRSFVTSFDMDDIGAIFATRAEFDAAMAAAGEEA